MSKKPQSNTLFQYFAKSPVSSKSPASSKFQAPSKSPASSKFQAPSKSPAPSKIAKLSEKGENIKSTKKESKDFEVSVTEPVNSSEDEDEIKTIKKRRRILTIDSDSDNENDRDQGNILKKKPRRNSTLTSKIIEKTIKEESTVQLTDIDEQAIDLNETIIRKHQTLDFLKPEYIKDIKGNRPDNPKYDSSTLFVPENFLNQLTPGMRQWWEFKTKYFDCILFFKVGKFYEFYHMDADISVQELGFNYMRGEFAHSGFPEISYEKMASILVEKGYKVARVEQTETPDMMTERCKAQLKVTKFDKVVKREICQITNKGTQVCGTQNQVLLNHTPNYMLSIVEKNEGAVSEYGICFIDTSIGEFYIGQFHDDKNSSRFLTLISHFHPVLILYEKHSISSRIQDIFRSALNGILKENLNDSQFWSGEKTLKFLAEHYYSNEEKKWPMVLKTMQDLSDPLGLTPNEQYKLCLKALGGCIAYMKKCFLDEQVLSMCHFNIYIPPDNYNKNKDTINLEKVHEDIKNVSSTKRQMVLDFITLSNLRVIESEYSLLNTLDFCCTKFGKRLLRYWICTPSCNLKEISDRQQSISEFLNNQDKLQEMRSIFNNLPDFERYLAQIHVFGNGIRLKNHPDGRAVFFEQKTYNKKKIQNFITTLNGFESLLNLPEIFKDFKTPLLQNLTQQSSKGNFPDMSESLTFFKNAFDYKEALKDGVVAPEKGVDLEFDEVENSINNIKEELKVYLKEQEKYFNCRLSYFGNDKKRFQIEVPENKAHKADKKYILESQKKGSNPVRRFHTNETKDFLKRIRRLEDKKNEVLRDLSRRIFEKFSNNYEMWKKCVDSVAVLDVLGSLAEYSKNQTQICVPEILENGNNFFIEVEDGYHPCMPSSNYIPNGILLGGNENAPLSLLTGPNMGGKSTLMRQIGLLVIMAQMGSHVPAKMLKMSLVDRIFTRLGAQDDILAGHSTFLVELNETASILNHATIRSLVLLDELGRGTATYDGTAIAASVVNDLANLKCRTIFSTHYHNLVEYFNKDKRIVLGHMACVVENEENNDPTEETVTFLYKYADGASPKSYGFNAAKLAGMPNSIIKRAHKLSKKVEAAAVRKKIISNMLCSNDINQMKILLSVLSSCKI